MDGDEARVGRRDARSRGPLVRARRARVAHHSLRGCSIRQIVVELEADGLSNPSTGRRWSRRVVHKDLLQLQAEWAAQAAADVAQKKAVELARIEYRERIAWEAFERSRGKRQKTVTERNDVGSGKKKATRNKARVETEDLYGDPRFLAEVREAGRDRRELLGLDAPKRNEHSGPGGGPISLAGDLSALSDEELTARIRQALDEGPDGGAEVK